MLSFLAKLLLAATALSPMLGAVAVNQAGLGNPYTVWLPWLIAGVVLVILCLALLEYADRNGEKHDFHIKEFEDQNKETLAFLLTYLLPFLSKEKLEFKGEWLTGIYIILIIVITIVHTGSFSFNPVLGLFYRFYAVKDQDGVSSLLICRNPIKKPGTNVETVRLSHNVYLERKKSDAN